MFSLFFIRRPIFASVISIVIVISGLVAMVALPVARYPDLAPPTVEVSTVYPGADAQTVADTVAATIEKEVNGVEGMIYMSSVSANDGTMRLTVTFEPGVDLDTANVLVQNRVAVAEARLPEEVKRQGVTVKKKSTDTVMYLAFYSPDGQFDDAYLSNYVWSRVRDELARVAGVGDVQVFGVGEFSMRIWLDPQKLKTRGLTASDVVAAVREQNVQVAAGRIGAAPALEGTAFEYVVSTKGRLLEPEEFERIVIKTSADGETTSVRDVARVELGSDLYNFAARFNSGPCAALAIYQIPGSNLIEVADGVRSKLDELEANFPPGLEYGVVYDQTEIITASIKEVIVTLFATLILVILTVYIFLQSFRATLVPAATIPVALIGTFAVLLALGFSINQMTLFGLVLVIGIVVDDAIVVVENATRFVEQGLSPKEATGKAMLEVSGPVIATTLVLLAVFVPTTFMTGISGTLFQQFAVTISVATVFSSINALTLSPALCGIVLRKSEKEPRGFFRWFNVSLEKSTNLYLGIVRLAVRRALIGVVLFVAVCVLAVLGLGRLPTGFVPQEDEGWCMVNMQLPDGASLERAKEALAKVEAICSEVPGVRATLAITGYSLLDGAASANTGFVIVSFEHWDERGDEAAQGKILATLNARFRELQEGVVIALPMPSLPGVGLAGGFTFMLQDRAGAGLDALQESGQNVLDAARSQSGLVGVNTTFRARVPQLFVDIDRDQVKKTGTSLKEVFDTLQIQLGSAYVNDFTLFGRVYKVMAQAAPTGRSRVDDIRRLELRGASGKMIPLGTVAKVTPKLGPQTITRFNLYPAMKILGQAAPGYSSGQALELMEGLAADQLPASMGYEWSELSYQEKASGSTAGIFIFAVIIVFLVLAAQYESWSLPISVVLSVPTAILGAVVALLARSMDNNVFTQVGIVLLIGLATKTAILIVEFAKVLRDEGKSIFDAAVEATRLRFRAVLMTAFSFVLGVLPLLVATGAGGEARQVVGTTVFGGMLIATVVSLAAVPMMYYVVQKTTEGAWGKPDVGKPADADAEKPAAGDAKKD